VPEALGASQARATIESAVSASRKADLGRREARFIDGETRDRAPSGTWRRRGEPLSGVPRRSYPTRRSGIERRERLRRDEEKRDRAPRGASMRRVEDGSSVAGSLDATGKKPTRRSRAGLLVVGEGRAAVRQLSN
jgi:hypothetical protein